MQIVLQKKGCTEYLGIDQNWTSDVSKARAFSTTFEACLTALTFPHLTLVVVIKGEDPRFDVYLPTAGTSQATPKNFASGKP
jgi:hypothetical protein